MSKYGIIIMGIMMMSILVIYGVFSVIIIIEPLPKRIITPDVILLGYIVIVEIIVGIIANVGLILYLNYKQKRKLR